MLCRLALLAFLGTVSACNAPVPEVPVPPRVQEKKTAPALSKQQAFELSERCTKKARDEFRRGWKEGAVNAADGRVTADYSSHYNEKLRTCFYLLTVTRQAVASPPKTTLSKMLYDANERELYGEYLGPETSLPAAGLPDNCRVTSFFCASLREWEVLVESYMED